MPNRCISCNTPLIWGGFAHNQDICWECITKEIKIINDQINQYPSWLWHKREEHKEILNWMMAVVAERFGKSYD